MLEWSDWRLGHNLLASEAHTFRHEVQIIVLGFLEPDPKYPTAYGQRGHEGNHEPECVA
jgi:hypothetical protein